LALISLLLGCFHFYWAFGGKWGVDSSSPELGNHTNFFKPSFLATIIVIKGFCAGNVVFFLNATQPLDFPLLNSLTFVTYNII